MVAGKEGLADNFNVIIRKRKGVECFCSCSLEICRVYRGKNRRNRERVLTSTVVAAVMGAAVGKLALITTVKPR